MGIKQLFVCLRDGYVIRHARSARFPEFTDAEKLRCRIEFAGRVQHVGFRLELQELAKRLGITGWCKNLGNGHVLAEMQGGKDRIDALLAFMESLKRIRVREKIVREIPMLENENGFEAVE